MSQAKPIDKVEWQSGSSSEEVDNSYITINLLEKPLTLRIHRLGSGNLMAPTFIIENLYQQVPPNAFQQKAFLCYLLQYQHYNAEFTRQESQYLSCPTPLLGVQEKPGYVRTKHEALQQIVSSWIESTLRPIFVKYFSVPQNRSIHPYIQFYSPAVLEVLEALFPNIKPTIVRVSLEELKDCVENILSKGAKGKYIFAIQPANCLSDECLFLWCATQHKNQKFFFLHFTF